MDARFSVGKCRVVIATFLFITMIFMCGCTPEPLELDGLNYSKSEIVVSSQILPDGSLAVFLSRTFTTIESQGTHQGALENLAIEDARVTVSSGSSVYNLQHVNHGIYVVVQIPFRVGQEYTLNVDSRSMGKVYAKTKLQPSVMFDTVKAKLLYSENSEPVAQVDCEFRDSNDKNFYMLNVQASKKHDLYSNMINPNIFTRILDDKDFNGQRIRQKFNAVNKSYYPGDSIAVTLTAISEDYFNYLTMRVNSSNELIEMFSEPVHYPSNVNGGRGFFNLHYPDGKVLVLN